MREAAWLKLSATAATSSRPDTSTRWCKAPAPNCSTPDFKACSRRVSRFTTGQAPAATATNSSSNTTAKPTPRCHTAGTKGRLPSDMNGPGGFCMPCGPPCCALSPPPPLSTSRRSPPGGGRIGPGRITHSVRPSSSRTAKPRCMPSPWRRRNESEAAIRPPCALSSASGNRSRCDQSSSAPACSAGGASAPGSDRWIRSPQAAMRSDNTESARVRSCSMWRWKTQPDTTANNSSTATTVR